jgi:Zn-finger nucleic acid-binding protein
MAKVMAAETLNCPMCGASASSDATRCGHCGARLATVACPSCFGMTFVGSKFCSHCGAKLNRKDIGENEPLPCPRCRTEMKAVVLGTTNLRECPRCQGLWADTASVEQICADREKQASILGMPSEIPLSESGAVEEKVRYLPCPECQKLMHRINFARLSNVVVDVCKGHGTWFDRDELRRIVEFIRAGGLDSARAREIDELEARRRQLSAAQFSQSAWDTRPGNEAFSYADRESGFSIAASLLKSFLR